MDVTAGREYAENSVAELARRAKKAGHLRPDFVLDDLILMLMANDGIHATSPAAQVNAARPPVTPRAGVDFAAGRSCKW